MGDCVSLGLGAGRWAVVAGHRMRWLATTAHLLADATSSRWRAAAAYAAGGSAPGWRRICCPVQPCDRPPFPFPGNQPPSRHPSRGGRRHRTRSSLARALPPLSLFLARRPRRPPLGAPHTPVRPGERHAQPTGRRGSGRLVISPSGGGGAGRHGGRPAGGPPGGPASEGAAALPSSLRAARSPPPRGGAGPPSPRTAASSHPPAARRRRAGWRGTRMETVGGGGGDEYLQLHHAGGRQGAPAPAYRGRRGGAGMLVPTWERGLPPPDTPPHGKEKHPLRHAKAQRGYGRHRGGAGGDEGSEGGAEELSILDTYAIREPRCAGCSPAGPQGAGSHECGRSPLFSRRRSTRAPMVAPKSCTK